jgi:hypothetical protein
MLPRCSGFWIVFQGCRGLVTITSYLLVFCCSSFLIVAQENNGRAVVEGSNNQWYVDDQPGRSKDAQIAEFLGRQSLWLRNGTQVMQSSIEFVDGTIEFDMAPMDKGNFVGLVFRRESFSNHENIYFRIHRSGLYNAVQYAPRLNGPTWQLYPEFHAVAELPRNHWTHVRVEVKGGLMEIYLNNASQPLLVVPRLRAIPTKGTVAFWSRVNGQPTVWAAAISNVSIRPATTTNSGSYVRPQPPADTLTSWEAAEPVAAGKEAVVSLPQIKEWRRMEVEESGLVNLNRLRRNSATGRWTAFARTTVKIAQPQTAKLELGYSDEVTVFLNGEIVYSGINGFESRHPEYMGFVKPGYENVFLKLRSGDNEIVLAVTDDQRFGWGFIARMMLK